MAWAAVAGAGVGLFGSVLAGNAAEDNASANQDAQRQLLGQQYGWQNNSRFNLGGALYGSDAINQLRGSSSKSDFDSRFGAGAYDFLRMTPQQQADVRAGRRPANPNAPLPPSPDRRPANAPPGSMFNTYTHDWRLPNGQPLPGQDPNLGVAANEPGFDPSSLDAFTAANSGQGVLGQLQDQATRAEGEGQGVINSFDQGTNQINSRFADTLGQYDTQSGDLQHAFNGVYNDAQTRANGMQGLASDWGKGEDKTIRDDAARSLAGANQQSSGRLAAMGLGNSTLVANQLGTNANESNRVMTNNLAGLASQQVDRQLGVMGQNNSMLTGLQQGNLGTLASRAQGRTGLQTGNLDFQAQRAGLRSGLQTDTLNRNIGLRQQPINTRLSLLTNPLMNPGTGINTSSFYSPSGAGSTQSAFAGALGNIGGRLFSGGFGSNTSNSRFGSNGSSTPHYADQSDPRGDY